MNFRFENGKVIKVETFYYSETHVHGGPGILSNRTEVSSSSSDACKVDVWIRVNDKDICITLNQPFKALENHDVTIAYTDKGWKVQLINNTTGQAIWLSTAARRMYCLTDGGTYLNSRSTWNLGRALIEVLIILVPFFILIHYKTLLCLVWLLGSLVYFGWKSAPNYKGGWKQSSLFYAPLLFALPVLSFIKDAYIYVAAAFSLIYAAKHFENLKYEPKETPAVAYQAAKALHYKQSMGS
ncbi:hypothetical protein [Shewanella algae]|uniref:hypothetical protein n=1 Tax=Shewanella algae TaxID=38313 RepID=UPI000C34ACDD|nr:hypothetical protein [Shewanella algae]MBO2630205.1 hypothetical protein [Shewanella algae]MBO2642846.1 hypothetical protein [Shewanella algae]HDS1213511.1 hypothetical protein [Shewanella algae]